MNRLILSAAIILAAVGCSTVVPVSGYEDGNVTTTCARGSDRYDGCFWNNRLWEDDWLTKKDTERTLKTVRTRIMPWQPVVAVFSFGLWVPVYVEWEMNGVVK